MLLTYQHNKILKRAKPRALLVLYIILNLFLETLYSSWREILRHSVMMFSFNSSVAWGLFSLRVSHRQKSHQFISGELEGQKFLHTIGSWKWRMWPTFLIFVLRLWKNLGKNSNRKLPRPGIEPRPAGCEARVTFRPQRCVCVCACMCVCTHCASTRARVCV